jgi:hypothetical protein
MFPLFKQTRMEYKYTNIYIYIYIYSIMLHKSHIDSITFWLFNDDLDQILVRLSQITTSIKWSNSSQIMYLMMTIWVVGGVTYSFYLNTRKPWGEIVIFLF